MSVVNVKVNCIRPKYNNLEEWMTDPNNVYIGRKGIVFINSERFRYIKWVICLYLFTQITKNISKYSHIYFYIYIYF